jgi:succinate dehydrogenase/fumarate reductase flavoprotein subunit
MKKDFSRRSFIAGAAVGLAGIAGGLIACTSDPASINGTSPENGRTETVVWDKEIDVLVIGSGTAAFGAVTAKGLDANTSVLIIEKADKMGGTSSVSGATMWIPNNYPMIEAGYVDSKADALAYMKACAAGRGDPVLFEAYLDHGPKFLEWTRDNLGWEWGLPPARNVDDYMSPLPGSTAWRGVRAYDPEEETTMVGPGTWERIQRIADEQGVEIMLETSAKSLITDESGTVVGIVASSGGKDINIKANKGIILGAGGYDHNQTMLRETQPFPSFNTNAVVGNVGDAQIMAAAIGAALSGMDGNWGWPAFINKPFSPNFDFEQPIIYDSAMTDSLTWRGKPGAVVVNKYGKRFGNEGSIYPVFNRAFGTWNSDKYEWTNIPGYFICDAGFTEFFTLPSQRAVGDPIPDMFVSADSLEELAGKLGIDTAGFLAEMSEFNRNAENGIDPAFHRGEHPVDMNTSGDVADLRKLKNKSIAPLVNPPFLGAIYVPGIGGTNGGIKINKNAQAIDIHGNPIPGLYAVGNCSASISGGAYCGAGMTVGAGSVMAWAAAMHIMSA